MLDISVTASGRFCQSMTPTRRYGGFPCLRHSVSRPNRVRLRYGPHLRQRGPRPGDYFHRPPRWHRVKQATTRLPPFRRKGWPGSVVVPNTPRAPGCEGRELETCWRTAPPLDGPEKSTQSSNPGSLGGPGGVSAVRRFPRTGLMAQLALWGLRRTRPMARCRARASTAPESRTSSARLMSSATRGSRRA